MALTDEQIAVRILALDEGESVDEWVAKWEPLFHGWSQEDHSGDCTKQPWTCSRCLYETTMARVPDFKRILNLCPPMTQNNMEVVAFRARYSPEKGYQTPWDLTHLDPAPYEIYDEIEPLVTLTSAQAEIATLKHANEALMRERANITATHREQLERLTKERDTLQKATGTPAILALQKSLRDVIAQRDEARAALRNIAEGNLGDDPWQANYEAIRLVARSALQPLEPKND